jgi:hypothetical protein
MSTKGVSSSLWIGAGVLGVGTALAFRDEPVPRVVTIVIGVLAVLTGIVLLRRTVPRVAPWSTALGIVWVACYVALAVWQLGDPAALTTDVGLALLGAGAALVARRQVAALA